MKRFNYLAALFVLMITALNVQARFADRSFYLLDSLNLETMGAHDKHYLDSCLAIWNSNAHDTVRANALSYWLGGAEKSEALQRYNELFFRELGEMKKRHQNIQVIKKLKLLTASSLHNMGFYWDGKDQDKALDYYFRSLEIKKSLGERKTIAQTLNNIGFAYSRKGDLDNQLKYYTESLQIREELNDSSGMASTLNNLGSVYKRQGNVPKALAYFSRSLKICEGLGNVKLNSYVLNNIGLLYEVQGELVKALEFHKRSMELSKQLESQIGIATNLNSIGLVYKKQENYSEALRYYADALNILESLGKTYQSKVATARNNIGIIHLEQKNFLEAQDFFTSSLKLNKAIGYQKGEVVSLRNLGSVYYEMDKMNEARKYAERSYALAKEIGYARGIRTVSYILYKIYKKTGNTTLALEMHEVNTLMKDSVAKEENVREILNYQYKYEYEKEALTDSLEFAKKAALKNLEIEKQQVSLSRQRIALASTAGGLLLLLVLAFTIYKGKKKSDELLLNILPYETAQELKSKGYADAQQFNQVTVLFTDFKGFTQMAERLTAHELVAEIDECFRVFDGIMEKYSIEKIKTIGDSYMAAGGLPTNCTNNPADVVSAALEIRDWMMEHKKLKGDDSFEIRIGIHTGPVVAGIVGIKKFAYDIWGDTVNTASRMESSGEPGKVNISETTFNLVADNFDCEYRGEVAAKGKGMVKMYFAENLA